MSDRYNNFNNSGRHIIIIKNLQLKTIDLLVSYHNEISEIHSNSQVENESSIRLAGVKYWLLRTMYQCSYFFKVLRQIY